MRFNHFFKHRKLTKKISLFISEKHNQIIIASFYINKAGIYYEQEKCAVYGFPLNTEDLGIGIIDNLNRMAYKDRNLRDDEGSDWPAYKHSKCSTIKSFENDYTLVQIGSVNDYNQVLAIAGYPYKNSDLTINASVSFYANKADIGRLVLKVYTAAITKALP
jgi:hypothetical protein